MKKIILIAIFATMAFAAQAQIKMHNSGQISFLTTSTNTTLGIQFMPNANANFNGSCFFKKTAYFTAGNNAGGWVNISCPANSLAQCWMVSSPTFNDYKFWVYGNGQVYSTRQLTISDSEQAKDAPLPIRGDEAVSLIGNINAYYFEEQSDLKIEDLEGNEYINESAIEGMMADVEKRHAAFSATELAEVFPDAVRTDPKGRICIDYQTVVSVLLVAVKEQQREIEELRSLLEKNGDNK